MRLCVDVTIHSRLFDAKRGACCAGAVNHQMMHAVSGMVSKEGIVGIPSQHSPCPGLHRTEHRERRSCTASTPPLPAAGRQIHQRCRCQQIYLTSAGNRPRLGPADAVLALQRAWAATRVSLKRPAAELPTAQRNVGGFS